MKYTAAVLGRMANGDDELDTVARDARLAARPATDKQKAFIRALLAGLEVDLDEVYPKDDVDELTMLDAKRLIPELKGMQ